MRFKRILSFVLSIVILISVIAGVDLSAYAVESSGSLGKNVVYSFNKTTGEMIISGTGDMDSYYFGSSFDNREKVKFIVIKPGVTDISQGVFRNCINLESIIIPNTVTRIGHSAFSACNALEFVTIPASVKEIEQGVFFGCASLREINVNVKNNNYISQNGVLFDKNMTTLIEYPSGKEGLEYTIPDSVKNISAMAFYNCSNLTRIYFPDGVKSIGESSFYGCSGVAEIILPDSITSIAASAFSECSNLVNLKLPQNLTSILNETFKDCQRLNSVVVPENVTNIGNRAFLRCESLTNIVLPSALVSIGSGAFSGCRSLSNVEIPQGVTEIGGSAFDGCSSLINVEIPQGVTKIGDYTFFGCSSLTSIEIPQGVTKIGDYAFSGCSSLSSIEIPQGVTEINDYAFYGCSSLSNVIMASDVKKIGFKAFYRCENLNNLYFPDSLKSIGANAFEYCAGLKELSFGSSVFELGSDAFGECKNIKKINTRNLKSWCSSNFARGRYSFCSNPLMYSGDLYVNDVLLTDLVVPDGISEIGIGAFYGCRSLKSVVFPNGLERIGAQAFSSCSNIEEITFVDSIKNIDSFGLDGVHNARINIPSIKMWMNCFTEYGTGYGNTSLEDYTLYIDNKQVKELEIPYGTTSIPEYAFFSCSGITNVSIPNTVTSIGAFAFYGLKDVVINVPSSVTSIGNDAFSDVANVKYEGKATGAPWGAKVHNGYIDGYLVFKDSSKKELVTCTSDAKGRVVIPDSVENFESLRPFNPYGIVSLVLPDHFTGYNNFWYNFCNIEYHGTDWRAPWGARTLNGYVDGDFVYENSSKKTLLACTRNISGRVVIPDSVTTIGKCAFDSCENITEIVIPDSVITISNSAFRSCKNITKIVIPDSVTSIGEYAFENCEKLKSIKLPNSIKRIRESTFGNSGLTSIIIPDSVTIIEKNAFSSCKNITEIDIPDSVTSIGEYAFAYCNNLKNVTVGEAVTSIDGYVFCSCSNLLSVSLPSSLERIGSCAFFGCSNLVNVKIPNGVTSIGDHVFSHCSNLVSIEIPNGVTSIPDYAFNNCDSLKEIALHNSIISIGGCSFRGCKSLTNILLSNKLETIGKNAFECCSNLKEITIPDSVKSIELYAFGSCYNLKDLTIGTGVEKIGNSAFINDSIKNVYIKSLKNWCNIIFTDMTSNPLSFSENFYVNGVLIKDLVITEDIQNVGNYAFRGYMNLRSVTINTGVKNIGVSAFSDCSSLTTVCIKKGLEKIGGSAFKNCPNLKTVNANSIKDWLGINFVDSYANPLSNQADLYVNKEIVDDVITPDGASGVYNYAFYGCRSLKSVSLQKGVETIGDSAFENCKNIATIDIPQSVNYVGAAAFKNCEKLKNVQLPKDVNTINNYLFYGCNNLLDVTIMGDVTKIGDFSFGYCNQLRGIAIPVHVKSIGKNAFENCKSLRGVIVPDSVTSIGESAFAACTNLNHVVLSNSIKTIASELFCGCANLITVKVPSGVKTIEDSAFAYCGLETISIPNSLEFVYSWAFNDCSNLTDVYYSGSEHEWNNIEISYYNFDLLSANIHFNSSYINSNICQIDKINLVFNAMDAYTKSGTAFKSNSKNANLVNVNYTNTSTKDCKRISTYYTAIDLDEAKSGDMIFEKEDYQAYIIPKAVSETWVQYSHARDNILYFSKDKKDGKPYVSSVYARTETDNGNAIMQSPYRDAVNNSITISRGMKCDVIISSPQSNIASYVIQQDANHKIISTTGVFRQQDLYSALETKKPVYAFVIDKNNVYSEAVKIKLEKVASNNVDKMMDSTSISLFGKNGFNTSVSSSAPMFGGLNINYGYSSIPIGVQYTGTKVRISIGLNLFDNSSTTSIYGNKSITEKEWNSFKNDIKGLQKSVESSTDKLKTFNSFRKTHKYCKDIPKFGKKCSVDGSFMGYVEFDVADGDLVVVDICGQLAGEVAIQFKQQFFVLGFPVYVYEEAGGELSFAVEGAKSVPDNDFPMEFSATLKVEPYVKVGAGAGAKGYVSAGVAGKGSLPIEWVMNNKHIKIDVTGSLLIEGEFFGISGSLPILSGEYNLVDKYYGESTSSENGANYVLYTLDDEEDKPKATLSNRDYIKHTSDWLSQATFKSMSKTSRSKASNIVSNTLQESVYKNSQVKIAKFDDTMMMVWIEDCKDRDTYNRYRLVYSVYDKSNKVWSEPNAVDDCGTMDYAPSLVSNGKDVYVAWQNINASVNKVDINSIISNAEIKLAKYDAQNDCFVDIQTITNNNSFDYVPNATFENGEIVVYYASCNNSDIGAEKSSSVKKFANNSTITVKSSLNFVSMLNTYGENYCFVSGGKLYNNRNAIELNEDMVIDAVYGQINGKIALFYGDAQGIHYIQDSKTVDLCTNNSVAGDFNVVEIGDSIRLLWNGVTESGSDLFSMEYVNGEWSSPIRLTEYDNNLSNVRAVGFDDSLYCVFDKTDDKNTVDDLTDDQTDLCTYTTTGFDSIDINLDFVDEYDFEEGKTVNITPVISNNGTDKIESITFEISDSNGYTKTVTKDVSILSGDLEAVDLQYDVPNDFDKSTISIVAKVNGENNEATDDGTIEVGFADLQMNELVVEEVEDTFVISGAVTNSNIVPAQDVVAEIYLGEEKSNLLEKSNLGVVEKNEGKTVTFTIPRDDLVFDNDGNCFVTFNVSTSSEEKLTDNNSSSANVHLYHNHNYLLVNDTSSCENDGFEKYRCESCDDEYEIEVKAKGHNYQISKPAKAPSCTENGNEEEQTCLNCGDVLGGSVIEPEGHNYQLSKPAKAPTCTEDGNEEEQICLNCGDVLGGNVIHCYGAHSFDEMEYTKMPTCMEDGEKSAYCEYCQKTIVETVPASESYHSFDEYEITKQKTCTQDGEKIGHCSVCDKNVTVSIPAGHDVVVSREMTSESSYDVVEYCFNCGVEFSREAVGITVDSISLGETKNVSVDEEKREVYFKFVAPQNATYHIYSTSDEDTYCTVYDGEFNLITFDDDGGDGNNFSIEIDLFEGKTYYFACRAYSVHNISFDITLENGHTHNYLIDGKNEATCEDGGFVEYCCSICYKSYTEYTSPKGHNFDDDELYCLNGCGKKNPNYNSNVESISYKCIKPIEYIENMNGSWEECDDCEKGAYYNYSLNWFQNGDILTVNYKDGTSIDYVCCDENFESDESFISCDEISRSSNQYLNHWTSGGENYLTYSYMNKSVQVPVFIVENPIASVEYSQSSPIILEEYIDSYEDYDDNDDAYEHYNYDAEKNATVVIHYKDGTSKTYKSVEGYYGLVDENFEELSCEMISWRDENYQYYSENHWYPGNTYSFIINIAGFEFTGYVNVTTHTHNFIERYVAPNCVDDGYTQYFCENCYYSYEVDFVPSTGEHNYVNGFCVGCRKRDENAIIPSISLNENYKVNIDSNGKWVYVSFVPEFDGAYECGSYSDCDTYGYLYDSNMDLLKSNDDYEDDADFHICYYLEQGKEYIFAFRMYSEESIGEFSVKLSLKENHNHSFYSEYYEPTIYTPGYTLHICEECGYSCKTDFVDPYCDFSVYDSLLAMLDEYDSEDYSSESYASFEEIANQYREAKHFVKCQEDIDYAVTVMISYINSLVPYLNLNVTVKNGTVESSVDSNSVLQGTEVTLTATPNDGYKFVGWFVKDTNRYFSTDELYTFTITSNTNLEAVFAKENAVTLTFTNDNGQVVKEVNNTVDEWNEITSIADILPDVPYKLGYSNGRWVYDEAEILANLKAGKKVTITPKYDAVDFNFPEIPTPTEDAPALTMYYLLNEEDNVGSFAMATGVLDGCKVESVGIAFYYKKASDFDPTKFLLTLNNKMLTSTFDDLDEDLYIVNLNKMSSYYNWSVRGYITYYDADGNLKTSYSNQINIVDRQQV